MNNATGRKETLKPTPEVLLDHWYPMWFIRSFLGSSNHYRSERKRNFPSHHSCKRPTDSTEFIISNIFHFLAMLYYMGVILLPSKQDYWTNNNPYMPVHPITRELDMAQDCFMFMWQNFHIHDLSDIDMSQEEEDIET
eukprot:15345018-Ditylum_brightwellii.AAC.1